MFCDSASTCRKIKSCFICNLMKLILDLLLWFDNVPIYYVIILNFPWFKKIVCFFKLNKYNHICLSFEIHVHKIFRKSRIWNLISPTCGLKVKISSLIEYILQIFWFPSFLYLFHKFHHKVNFNYVHVSPFSSLLLSQVLIPDWLNDPHQNSKVSWCLMWMCTALT